MSKAKYNALIKNLHQGMMEAEQEMAAEGIDVDIADMGCEVARNAMDDDQWVEPFLKTLGVSDFLGRMADDIFSGAQIR